MYCENTIDIPGFSMGAQRDLYTMHMELSSQVQVFTNQEVLSYVLQDVVIKIIHAHGMGHNHYRATIVALQIYRTDDKVTMAPIG